MRVLTTVSVCLLVLALARSAVLASELPNACAVLDQANDVLKCALSQSRDIRLGQASIKEGLAQEQIAAQRPNPEVGSSLIFGRPDAVRIEATLLHTIETGGKRESRIEHARAKTKLAEAKLLGAKEEVAVTVVLALYKLRQELSHVEHIQETITTYEQVIKRYSGLPALSPEQKAEKATLKVAKDHLNLELNEHDFEIRKLKALLAQAIGRPLPDHKRILPPLSTGWPDLSDIDLAGSIIQTAKAEEELRERSLSAARSNTQSNIQVGPTIEYEIGERRRFGVGAALTMELPFFHRYEGNVELAQTELTNAKAASSMNRDLLSIEKKNLSDRYRTTVEMFKNASAAQEADQDHKELHQAARRGIIQAGTIIELHRQILDYHDQLHVLELSAIEALWRLYAIAGKIETAAID